MTVGLTATDAPEIRYVPPHETLYQFQFALPPSVPPVCDKVAEFPEHKFEEVVLNEVGTVDWLLIVTVTEVRELTQADVYQKTISSPSPD